MDDQSGGFMREMKYQGKKDQRLDGEIATRLKHEVNFRDKVKYNKKRNVHIIHLISSHLNETELV